MEQLEGEVAGMRGQLAVARSDLAAARADSVKLYEKIRYLQRFSAKQAASDGFQVVQVDSEGVSHPKVTAPSNPGISTGFNEQVSPVFFSCRGNVELIRLLLYTPSHLAGSASFIHSFIFLNGM